MEYTITFTEQQYEQLQAHLFIDRSTERAAYLLCGTSITDRESRLLVKHVIPVEDDDIDNRTATGMVINSGSYVRAIKLARDNKLGFVFVHSHPEGFPKHSAQDDTEEKVLFKTVHERVEEPQLHGSIVLSAPDQPVGRIWTRDGKTMPMNFIRVIGKRFVFFNAGRTADSLPQFFDRQILAFGDDIQKALRALRIGIVGVGGTGSAVAEQLIRLGVGTLNIFDGDSFDQTNVNRVYGSRVADAGTPKVEIIKRLASEIGLGTEVHAFGEPITSRKTAEALRDCDVVFGCTDNQLSRSILCSLTNYYHIPVIDMGVLVDSKDQKIESVRGRVTTITPGSACLFCREDIDPKMIESEVEEMNDPGEAKKRRGQGYIPELPGTAPSVIPFTTATAASAVVELMQRITGFMGKRDTTEVIILFEEGRQRGNSTPQRPNCGTCGNLASTGMGDVKPFLGMTWQHEN